VSEKTTGRRSTIALSILTVILIALLGLLYYNYSTALSSKDLQISSLASENEKLKAQVQELEDIVSLRKSETWISR
jgi:cell division protein FtsB